MKKAILIHGWPEKDDFFDMNQPSSSNDQWLPWLQKQLVVRDIDVQTPEMPKSYNPNYELWKEAFENLKPDENTLLVGHSCGGGFLIRWLSENNIKVGKVVLVAPWIDPDKEYIDPEFFDFQIDEYAQSKTGGITLIYSDNDYDHVSKSVDIIKRNLKDIKLYEMKGKGHFIIEHLGGSEFPELLEEILS